MQIFCTYVYNLVSVFLLFVVPAPSLLSLPPRRTSAPASYILPRIFCLLPFAVPCQTCRDCQGQYFVHRMSRMYRVGVPCPISSRPVFYWLVVQVISYLVLVPCARCKSLSQLILNLIFLVCSFLLCIYAPLRSSMISPLPSLLLLLLFSLILRLLHLAVLFFSFLPIPLALIAH